MILSGWIFFAAFLLVISLMAHASTLLGVDPMAAVPGVMFIHILIFPPFIAAMVYASRVGGSDHGQSRVTRRAPKWMQIVAGVFFVYALINFVTMMIGMEGASTTERDGKYYLSDHGQVIRELTEEEFHQKQATIVRGFSGHWMLFSSAAMMMLAGAKRMRADLRQAAIDQRLSAGYAPETLHTAARPEDILSDDERAEESKIDESRREAAHDPDPEPATMRQGLTGLAVYLCCIAVIIARTSNLAVPAAIVVVAAGVKAFRRKRGFPNKSFESMTGCLLVFPNAFAASRLGMLVAEFFYVSIFVSPAAAITMEVRVDPTKGVEVLSNGDAFNRPVWTAMMIFIMFPVFALGTLGLSYMAEWFGRWLEVRKNRNT